MFVVRKIMYAIFLALLVSVMVESAATMKRQVKFDIDGFPEYYHEFPPIETHQVDKSEPLKNCDYYEQNCGWSIYVPYTKKFKYFMRNSCFCSPDRKCIRYSDELQMSAYLYKCLAKYEAPIL